MLHYLISVTDPDTARPGYTKEALQAEALTLAIAGSDTISVILAGFFLYIVRTPSAYQRLAIDVLSLSPGMRD
jgi:cytochrome P450